MKAITIAILIIAAGLIIATTTGCSKKTIENQQGVENQVIDTLSPEITQANPDIGGLDDSQVSDELPQ